MVAIVDYGVGNLFSLKCSFEYIGQKTLITGNADEILNADRVILPGVGAFGDASKKLVDTGLDDCLKECVKNNKPLMGICLGMQLLFDKSYEYGEHKGLGFISGEIKPIGDVIDKNLKVPHIGWNKLIFTDKKSKLFKYINDGDFVYFVHSYYGANCKDSTIANTEYGGILTSAVECGNVYGCQFHPEKSGQVGMNILRGFCEI